MEQNNELYHWGVPGMRWGVRRGRKPSGNRPKHKKQPYMSQDAREAKRLKKKKVSEMSNAELRKVNERRNLERNYKNLNPSTVAKGIAVVGVTAAVLGNLNGIKKNSHSLIKSGQVVVNRIFNK